MRPRHLGALAALVLTASTLGAAAEEWRTVRSAFDNFEVAFPGPTEYASKANPANQSERHSWSFSPSRYETYAVTIYQRRPGALPKTPDLNYYQGAANAYAGRGRCTLRDAQTIVIVSHPGFEAACDHEKDGILDFELHELMDMVVVGDRFYLIISAGPKGHETSDKARRFRDSFKLYTP